MKREKSKLELWIERYLKAEVIGYSQTEKSRYYRFNTRILRVSDHVSNCWNGDLSIILDSHDTFHFLVHAVRTGEISVLTYPQVRYLIRAISLLPATMQIGNSEPNTEKLPKDIKREVVTKPVSKDDLLDPRSLVLGIHISKFKQGQQQAIFGMVNKVKDKQK